MSIFKYTLVLDSFSLGFFVYYYYHHLIIIIVVVVVVCCCFLYLFFVRKVDMSFWDKHVGCALCLL